MYSFRSEEARAEEARELLIRLVEIPSVTYDEDAACRYLMEALSMSKPTSTSSFPDTREGAPLVWEDIHRDEVGNVVARRGSGDREIVLMGHIDTVSGGPCFRVEGDVLWGRGSVDAKGPLCAFAMAGGAAQVLEGWRITLIAAVGEEGDSRGARHVLPFHSPAACVIGEPSGTSGVTLGYRGYLRFQVHAQDSGAHRSGNPGPITACLMAAADILGEVERRNDTLKPVIERPSGAVIAMRGTEEGERTGFVDLDVRLPVGADPTLWGRDFIELGERRGVTVEMLSSMSAHLVDKNNPIVRALRLAVREAGLTPRFLVKGGTADFNLAAAWSCPMAAYGPGDSKLDHTAEEHTDLNDYLRSISILKNALEKFMEP